LKQARFQFALADYYFGVTGELDKAAQTYQEILGSYPQSAERKQEV
jgi:hypothetical protein